MAEKLIKEQSLIKNKLKFKQKGIMVFDRNDPDFKAINSREDAIKFFEKKGIPLTEDEKAIFYSDLLLKRSDNKQGKKCKLNLCYNGVWCSEKKYCDYHGEHQEYLNFLVQQKTSLANIQEVVRFSTWWSNNCATVINGNKPYTLWVLVYEPAIKRRTEILKKFEITAGYDKHSSESVKNKANSIRNELNGDNPILAIYPYATSYVSFSSIIISPYVNEISLPVETRYEKTGRSCTCYPDCPCYACNCHDEDITIIYIYPNPSEYLKPLDVVKIKKYVQEESFYHMGIYLGNNQVCHFCDPYSKKSTDNMKVRITSWDEFVRESSSELIRMCPIIPFRNYKIITQNIAWDESNDYGEKRYCLANNNCEHYSYSRVFCIKYSKQVEERPSMSSKYSHHWITTNYDKCSQCRLGKVNNGENGSFILRNELEEKLNRKVNSRSQEIERKYEIEISPRQDCRIM